jgi:hypothetical protein
MFGFRKKKENGAKTKLWYLFNIICKLFYAVRSAAHKFMADAQCIIIISSTMQVAC